MIGKEPDPPYMRPNLSKGLWKGRPVEKIWRKTEERAELHLDRKAVQLDPAKKSVVDDAGDEYTYDRLLIATGGTPNRLPFGDGNIIYYRTFQDYQHLRGLTEQGEHFVVIGGSFIGSETAASLRSRGVACVVVTLDAAAYDKIEKQARADATGEPYEPDEEAVELAAKRARALRHALAEYELRSFVITPGRALGEILAR